MVRTGEEVVIFRGAHLNLEHDPKSTSELSALPQWWGARLLDRREATASDAMNLQTGCIRSTLLRSRMSTLQARPALKLNAESKRSTLGDRALTFLAERRPQRSGATAGKMPARLPTSFQPHLLDCRLLIRLGNLNAERPRRNRCSNWKMIHLCIKRGEPS